MWYLQPLTLALILAFAALSVLGGYLLRRAGSSGSPQEGGAEVRRKRITPLLVLGALVLLVLESRRLAAFYVAYTLCSYFLLRLLERVRERKRLGTICFVLFCFLDVLPFLYARLSPKWGLPLVLPVLIGFSYNMLKAVDALYYVYYAGLPVRFPAYCGYLLYFPVLSGGPIFRYREFVRYYEEPILPDAACTLDCVKRLIRGMFKKVVLVFWLGELISRLLAFAPRYYISAALACLSYLLLYLDMSGYADMAVAVSTLCGIPAPENFNRPWTAASFTQFWRKWHITLSDWIREHIFILLRGITSPKAAARDTAASPPRRGPGAAGRREKLLGAAIGFTTLVVMSLWHEFSRAAVMQGAFLGAILAAENLLNLGKVNRLKTPRPVYILRCAAVTAIFAVNAMFFTMDHGQMVQVLKGFLR